MKLAVIGLNFGKKHASYIAEGKVRGNLAAVVDLDPKFEELAKKWNTKFYTDYKKMLEEIQPDGVVIAVPPKLHPSFCDYMHGEWGGCTCRKAIALTSKKQSK